MFIAQAACFLWEDIKNIFFNENNINNLA